MSNAVESRRAVEATLDRWSRNDLARRLCFRNSENQLVDRGPDLTVSSSLQSFVNSDYEKCFNSGYVGDEDGD